MGRNEEYIEGRKSIIIEYNPEGFAIMNDIRSLISKYPPEVIADFMREIADGVVRCENLLKSVYVS